MTNNVSCELAHEVCPPTQCSHCIHTISHTPIVSPRVNPPYTCLVMKHRCSLLPRLHSRIGESNGEKETNGQRDQDDLDYHQTRTLVMRNLLSRLGTLGTSLILLGHDWGWPVCNSSPVVFPEVGSGGRALCSVTDHTPIYSRRVVSSDRSLVTSQSAMGRFES